MEDEIKTKIAKLLKETLRGLSEEQMLLMEILSWKMWNAGYSQSIKDQDGGFTGNE